MSRRDGVASHARVDVNEAALEILNRNIAVPGRHKLGISEPNLLSELLLAADTRRRPSQRTSFKSSLLVLLLILAIDSRGISEVATSVRARTVL